MELRRLGFAFGLFQSFGQDLAVVADVFEADGDLLGDAGLLHGHTVDGGGAGHGFFRVRDDDELRPGQEVLQHFDEAIDVRLVEGRVDFDIAQGSTLPLEAVDAVARWCATFLATARKLIPEIERIQVRQTTVLMEHALEQVGFYTAFDKARSTIT